MRGLRAVPVPLLAVALVLAVCAFSRPQTGPEQIKDRDPDAGLYKCHQGSWPVSDTQSVRLYNDTQKRDLELSVVYPASGGGAFPVIIWSHGAFGSEDGYDPLVRFWASHGYVVIRPRHLDSAQNGTIPSFKNVFAFSDWDVRPLEIKLIIDRLDDIERRVPALAGHIDRKRLGMGGHSYGAQTAQLLAGGLVRGRFLKTEQKRDFSDPRIQAFVMISPMGPDGVFDRSSFAGVSRPVLAVTGDNDDAGRTKQPASWRRQSWQLMAAGDKFLLWIADAYHGFGGISGGHRWEGAGPMNQRQVDYVRCTGLAFWDAYLKNQRGGLDYLNGDELAAATQGAARLERR